MPGTIVLYEQPSPPWRPPGSIAAATAGRLECAGAISTPLPDAGAMPVDWPEGALRRFMLEEVRLHEIGHYVLQHHTGKRLVRIARTRDHEAFAARFAEKERAALLKREPCAAMSSSVTPVGDAIENGIPCRTGLRAAGGQRTPRPVA